MRRLDLGILMLVCGAAVATLGSAESPNERKELDGFERFVSADGALTFDPAAIQDLVHIGSWFVPEGGAAGFHGVYTQRQALEAYRETGVFPDGAVLVKELRAHKRGDYTTGANVASAGGIGQWFLLIKDSGGRFPEHPLWGNGWGWGLFKPDAPSLNLATSYQADCLGCHAPAAQTGWIYVDAYPALHE